jgi:hypothetical protein
MQKDERSKDVALGRSQEGDNIKKAKSKQKKGLLMGYKQLNADFADVNYNSYMAEPEEQCTFLRTGKRYHQQFWYQCYTCGLVGSTGACSVCVRVCHKGHHVVICKKSSFYCDCGQDGRKCDFLKD